MNSKLVTSRDSKTSVSVRVLHNFKLNICCTETLEFFKSTPETFTWLSVLDRNFSNLSMAISGLKKTHHVYMQMRVVVQTRVLRV